MQKIFKLTGISMLAIMTANVANAAGYTCEELIEYTSCNDGYYLNAGDCIKGATCGAGNYLVGTCPSDYYEEDPDDGRYLVSYTFDTGWCAHDGSLFFHADSEEECKNSQWDDGETLFTGVWHGMGCVSSNGDFVAAEYTCTSCASGTYQPSAGQYSCITCPAGSECPTTTAATLCEIGEYSAAGATACSTCPATGLTDKDGNTVVATTESQGSTSVSACIVGSDVYFKNDIGIYHYKQKCEYGNFGVDLNQSVTNAEECDKIGGSWNSGEMWCDVDVADFLPSKEVCEAWRALLADEDYRDAITCYEDGGASCGPGAMWYFNDYGLGCDW